MSASTSETIAHSPQRFFAVDALKGFAIACVVMGHIFLRNAAHPASNAGYLFLSAFEMPLFMFLSGFVLPGKVRGSRAQWVWRRAVRLLVPFFAWHAIFFASRQLGAGRAWTAAQMLGALEGGALYLAHTIAAPTAGLWYLPSLLLCSAVLALFWPLAEKPLLLLLAGWLTFGALGWLRIRFGFGPALAPMRAALGFVPDFGLLKTITYWPFFAAGFTWGQWKCSLEFTPPRWVWAPATTAYVVAYPPLAVFAMRQMPAMSPVLNGATKIALGLGGVAFAAVLIGVLAGLARTVRLDVLGRLTLGVYCAQWLFLRVPFGDTPLALAGGFAVVLTASILVTLVIGRFGWLKGVLLGEWPSRKAVAS